jgi:hypothetical protein
MKRVSRFGAGDFFVRPLILSRRTSPSRAGFGTCWQTEHGRTIPLADMGALSFAE